MNIVRYSLGALLLLSSACMQDSRSGLDDMETPVVEGTSQSLTEPAGESYWPVPGVPDGDGFKRTWDGTAAELLAADAMVACWNSVPLSIREPPVTDSYISTFVNGNGFGDPIISGLVTKMIPAICLDHIPNPPKNPFEWRIHELFNSWTAARNDPKCSFDPASSKGRSIDLKEARQGLSFAEWKPPANTPLAAQRDAEAELAYADLYLCMSQRLVEHTKSSFVFQASNEEVLRLYDLARNRTLISVFQYALLAKIFGIDDSQLTGLAPEQYGALAALKDWARKRSKAEASAAGRDLALAIDTLAELTKQQVTLLRRDASKARDSGAMDHARQDVLRTLYGDATRTVSSVQEDLSDPEIAILLGLVRKADALDLDVKVENGSITIDRDSSAKALLRAAERQFLVQQCPAGDGACATVGEGEPVDYTVRQMFGIGQEHAERLVGALAQAIFGPPEKAGGLHYTEPQLTPPGIGRPLKMAGAQNSTCALFDQGRVACWGAGLQQPGTAAAWIKGSNDQPVERVVDIAAGADQACALTEDGQVLCWGSRAGIAPTPSAVALPVFGLPDYNTDPVRELSARATAACAVTSSGSVYCWSSGTLSWWGGFGDGTHGGDSCTTDSQCGPIGQCTSSFCATKATVRVANITDVRTVAMGVGHVCALKKSGDVYCWGENDRAQLGAVEGGAQACSVFPCRYLPTRVALPTRVGKVVDLAATDYSTCALNAGGEVFCWGDVKYVGSNATSDGACPFVQCSKSAQQVRFSAAADQTLRDIVDITSGQEHVCALDAAGKISCWGGNTNGQLGNGNKLSQQFAVSMTASRQYGMLAGGHQHTCALSGANAWCWGLGTSGQLGSGTVTSLTPVQMTMPAQPPAFTPPATTPQERVSRLASRSRAPFHLLGVSMTSDANAPQQRVHLSQEFDVVGLSGHELQVGTTLRHVPARVLDVRAPARGQGFLYRRFAVGDPAQDGWQTNEFEWGTVPTLALARESIIGAATNADFFTGASTALDLIDSVIGTKTAMLRKKLEVRDALTRTCTGTASPSTLQGVPGLDLSAGCRETRAEQGGGRTKYELSVSTLTQDPIKTIAFGPRVTHALDKAMRPALPVLGSSSADILATSRATLATAAATGNRELRTAEMLLKSPMSVFFEQPEGNVRSDSSFLPIFDGELREIGNPQDFVMLDGAIISYGGTLNALASETFEVQPTNWSRPQYDAYGLPTDWVPSADPALLGSNGEEPYQFFLRLAEDTAREATKAIEDAFEFTRQEETDAQALKQANEKSSELRKQEAELLCGTGSCPTPAYGVYSVVNELPDATMQAVDKDCVENTQTQFSVLYCIRNKVLESSVVAPVRLPRLVWDQRNVENPSFPEYENGELGKRMLEAWAALRRIRDAYRTAKASLERSATETVAAFDEAQAAQDAIAAAKVESKLQAISLKAQRDTLIGLVAGLRSRLETTDAAVKRVCSEDGFNRAVESGRSYSGPKALSTTYYAEDTEYDAYKCLTGSSEGPIPDGSWCWKTGEKAIQAAGTWDFDSTPDTNDRPSSWSPGAVHAWHEQCEQLKAEQTEAAAQGDANRLAALNELLVQIDEVGTDAERDLAAGVTAAMSRALAAESRAFAAQKAEVQTFVASVGTLQEAYSALLASVKELELAEQRTNVAKERYELDQNLVGQEIELRQKLRRRYQGFARWRADAMAESARRTAVAARRAIESRFVVDLSKMGNDEPFVAPPSVWADDVYDRDLKPPAAVGVTQSAPTSSSEQLYSNKLLDYVSNLRLFVAGYSIERPTSVGRNDAEVVTLAAPFGAARADAGPNSYAFSDPDSLGWRFECASGKVEGSPTVGAFGALDGATLAFCSAGSDTTDCPAAFDEGLLNALCDGDAPVRALYRFWMDPWGRVDGNPFAEPFQARHNARWREFAINLVGTGIRECEKADDPDQCYAEPFVRYGLRHVGPAWVTSYDLQWRTLVIPSAVVEDGKALAIEEWLDPVSRGWSVPEVQAAARTELGGRPLGGVYELSIELTRDLRLSRIERIQMLTSVDYWVRQN